MEWVPVLKWDGCLSSNESGGAMPVLLAVTWGRGCRGPTRCGGGGFVCCGDWSMASGAVGESRCGGKADLFGIGTGQRLDEWRVTVKIGYRGVSERFWKMVNHESQLELDADLPGHHICWPASAPWQ